MSHTQNINQPNSTTDIRQSKNPFRGWRKWALAILLLTAAGIYASTKLAPNLSHAAELAGGEFTHHNSFANSGIVPRIKGVILAMAGQNHSFNILQFDGGQPKDKWLKQHRSQLADLNMLTMHLRNGAITDQGLKTLEGMKSIQHLGLSCCALSDTAVESLTKMPNLLYADLSCTGISAEAVQRLTKSTQLAGLAIDKTQATDSFLKHLATLPKLEMLTIVGATDETIEFVDPNWMVTRLTLMEAKITTASLPKLKALGCVQNISFAEDSITNEQIDSIRRDWPGTIIQRLSEHRFLEHANRIANEKDAN